jgi:hypothetical protein
MGRKEKAAYLDAIRKRYRNAKRREKKAILDEFCAVCKFNRKYAIRLLGKQKKKQKAKHGYLFCEASNMTLRLPFILRQHA